MSSISTGIRNGRLKRQSEEKAAYWVLVLPAFVIFLFVMAFPVLFSIFLSVTDYGNGRLFGPEATYGIVGFGEYEKALSDPYFWNALKNNIYVILISVFGQIPLGFIFAYLIFRKLVKAPGFWQGIIYMPAIISPIVVGILWGSIFSPFGPISEGMNASYKGNTTAAIERSLNEADRKVTPELMLSISAQFQAQLPETTPMDYAREKLTLYFDDTLGTTQEEQQQALNTALAEDLSGHQLAGSTVSHEEILSLVSQVKSLDDEAVLQQVADKFGPLLEAAQKEEYLLGSLPGSFVLGQKLTDAEAKDFVEGLTNLLTPKWSPDFLNIPDVSMLPILFVILWGFTGTYLIILLANMQTIDVSVIEAARIDGAGEGQIMWHVILPSLSGVIVTCIILAITGSMNTFALIQAMTGGGPTRMTQVLALYSYDMAFKQSPDLPFANAITVLTVAISIAFIGVTRLVSRLLSGGKKSE